MSNMKPAPPLKRTLRCAIYTRKSTEEGLDQDFNSLDAQRDSALAFIRSQQREGWRALPAHYDDGGFSGANMDRPALTRLLDAVRARQVDCVVVYKVDRLSRSLLDFARIMSLFDEHKVGFVSVTQQFNTSNSLGRLTLHILLSFAAFERDLVSDRTRDKMSAARRKGKWTGGYLPLGYDLDPRRGGLTVNRKEAERVRAIFALFEQHRSIRVTVAEIRRRGWKLKSWTCRDGRLHQGAAFSANALRRLLTNVVYVGDVPYKDAAYAGEHEALLDRATWDRVQALFRHYRPETAPRHKQQALLNGLLHCQTCGTPMILVHCGRNGRRYRYYVCRQGRRKTSKACRPRWLPAQDIEAAVLQRLIESGVMEAAGLPGDLPAQIELLQQHLARVDYDSASGRVQLQIRER